MLVELLVENFAVVERARVRFHAGLNLLTGETGSGKSLVVDALGLLFGGRASADLIRTDAERARITGIFEAPVSTAAKKLLAESGIEAEDGELLVEREILANGKSRAFVGSRPVTAALLRDLSRHLGDIHGQHDQQQLFSPASQREMLDSFAGCESQTAELGATFLRWKAISAELDDFERNEQEKLRMADLWSFQKKEIEAVAPLSGEEAALENERSVLRNVSRLQENAASAHSLLYDAEGSAAAQLRVALRRIEELARVDDSQRETAEALKPALIAVEEAGRAMAEYVDRLEANPDRLEEVETRLAA
ncbi:MAG: AAA family ATPase, partial [Bryobacteraceae bacterium]